MYHCFSFTCYKYTNAAYPAVYGQFPQAIPPPLAAVAPSQREGKFSQKKQTNKQQQHSKTIISCGFECESNKEQ